MKCTDRLVVIVTAKDSVEEIRATAEGSNVFNRIGCSAVLVTALDEVPSDVSSHFTSIIKDSGNGVYQAMNEGLRVVKNRYSAPFIAFCNAGDLLSIDDLGCLQGDRCFVTDINIFREHAAISLNYISRYDRLVEMASRRFRHPGFIAPRAGADLFSESKPISADQAWMRSLVERYDVDAVSGKAGFGLGGVSTTYELSLVKKYIYEHEFRRGAIVLGRIAVGKLQEKFFIQDSADSIASNCRGLFAVLLGFVCGRPVKERIYVLSNGRSGSTMVYNALAGAMSKFYRLPRSALTLTDWEFKNNGKFPGVVKSHMPCPDVFSPQDGCKYIYVAGDPVDATLSLLSRLQEFGVRWMEHHARHLGVEREAIFACLRRDSFGQYSNIASWRKAAEKHPDQVMFIPFDKLWDKEEEISRFIGFDCRFPKKHARRSEKIEDRLIIKNELEKIFWQ